MKEKVLNFLHERIGEEKSLQRFLAELEDLIAKEKFDSKTARRILDEVKAFAANECDVNEWREI